MKKIGFAALLFSLPFLALAGDLEYVPMVGLPIIGQSTDFNGYINALYVLSIMLAALLAVIKIVVAGVKWMLTDIVTTKGQAKKDIQGALLGLIIVLSAVIILTLLNESLIKTDLQFGKVDPASYRPAISATTAEVADDQVYMSFDGLHSSLYAGEVPTDAELRDLCENVKSDVCPADSAALEAGFPVAACYTGTYDADKDICIVPTEQVLAGSGVGTGGAGIEEDIADDTEEDADEPIPLYTVPHRENCIRFLTGTLQNLIREAEFDLAEHQEELDDLLEQCQSAPDEAAAQVIYTESVVPFAEKLNEDLFLKDEPEWDLVNEVRIDFTSRLQELINSTDPNRVCVDNIDLKTELEIFLESSTETRTATDPVDSLNNLANLERVVTNRASMCGYEF